MEGRRKIQYVRVTTGWANLSGLAEVTREEYLEYAVEEKEMKWPLKETCII